MLTINFDEFSIVGIGFTGDSLNYLLLKEQLKPLKQLAVFVVSLYSNAMN